MHQTTRLHVARSELWKWIRSNPIVTPIPHRHLVKTYSRAALRHTMPWLIPVYFAVLLGLVQLDALVHWPLVRERIAALPTIEFVAWGAGLLLMIALVSQGAFVGLARSPFSGWLRRQPLDSFQVGFLQLASTLPVWPLLLGWAWLFDQPLALIWALVALTALVQAKRLRWLAFATLTFVSVAIQNLHDLGALLNLLWWLTLLPVGRWYLHVQLKDTAVQSSKRWPISPTAAIACRDLLCLWRTDRSVFYSAWVLTLLCGLMAFAIARHGVIVGDDALLTYVIFLFLLSITAYGALESLVTKLGPQRLVEPRWPVSRVQRVSAMGISVLALIGPGSLLFLAILGIRLGPAPAFAALLITACMIVVAILSLNLKMRWMPRSSAIGFFLLIQFVATLLALAAPVVVGPILLVILFSLTLRTLPSNV